MRGERFDWKQYARLLRGKKSSTEIAGIIGCTAQTVRNQRRKMGIAMEPDRKLYEWSEWDHVVMDASIPTTQAAKMIGCACGTLEYRRRKMGMENHVAGVQDIRRFNYLRYVQDMLNGESKPLHEYHEMIVSPEQMKMIEAMEDRRDESRY